MYAACGLMLHFGNEGHNATMDKGLRYLPPASQCHYLPDEQWRLEYRVVVSLTQQEYLTLVRQGWRRFGAMLFRPRCPTCTACQPIRIIVDQFRPDRSQRRVARQNADTKLVIGEPTIDEGRMDLYLRHHEHHAHQKGWPSPTLDDAVGHMQSIVDGPLPVQEWAYYRDNKLVAISYIDELDEGFSGIYFYHDPDHRQLSLGTWICLSLIEEAGARKFPYVYMGYYIQGCRSMEYKARFVPNQVLVADGSWRDFLE
jgi:arginine-tRNA-protein transferase